MLSALMVSIRLRLCSKLARSEAKRSTTKLIQMSTNIPIATPITVVRVAYTAFAEKKM